MERRGLKARKRVMEGHSQGFKVYSESRELSGRRGSVPIFYAALFDEHVNQGRDHNAELLHFVKSEIPPPSADVIPLNSPFSPIEKSAALVLPFFLQQSPAISIQDVGTRENPCYRLSSLSRVQYRPEVLFIRNPLLDEEGTGLYPVRL